MSLSGTGHLFMGIWPHHPLLCCVLLCCVVLCCYVLAAQRSAQPGAAHLLLQVHAAVQGLVTQRLYAATQAMVQPSPRLPIQCVSSSCGSTGARDAGAVHTLLINPTQSVCPRSTSHWGSPDRGCPSSSTSTCSSTAAVRGHPAFGTVLTAAADPVRCKYTRHHRIL
jgi:hypothetical protein